MSEGTGPGTHGGENIEALLARLEEAESTLEAIRQGEVDALVISGPLGDRVFTLESADQSYRILVETMNEGAATVAADGLILYANRRLAELLRVPAERLTGSSLQSLFAAGEENVCSDLLRTGGAGWHSETVLRASDGTAVPAMVSANLAEISQVPTICVVVTDLTSQKRSEELVASERLARSILEQAGEAITVCDAGGCIIRVNEAARRLSAPARIGASFDEAFPLRSAGGEDFSIAAIIRGGRAANLEAGLPSGAIVLVSAAPLSHAEAGNIGAVVTLTDITERKRNEEMLRSQSEALARSNADLERFAFAASHDLQEPLRIIMTYTQLLVRAYADVPGAEVRQFAGYIEGGVERMRSLIRDLLSYSRVIHAPSADFRDVDLSAALRIALANLQSLIQESGAKITAGPLPWVHGDDGQLTQVLQNLIGNAVKYSTRRTAEVHISAAADDQGHIISVRDNGDGIADKYREQVFGLFKRLHGKDIPGSGIGLALCKRIVDGHGGRIWVEGNPDHGSTFRFTLPSAHDH